MLPVMPTLHAGEVRPERPARDLSSIVDHGGVDAMSPGCCGHTHGNRVLLERGAVAIDNRHAEDACRRQLRRSRDRDSAACLIDRLPMARQLATPFEHPSRDLCRTLPAA